MKYLPTREVYNLLSFELTDRFAAWYIDDDGVEFESPIHAIGIASVTQKHVQPSTGEIQRSVDLGNMLVGIQFGEDGVHICDEAGNFSCVLPKGQKPTGAKTDTA